MRRIKDFEMSLAVQYSRNQVNSVWSMLMKFEIIVNEMFCTTYDEIHVATVRL